MEFFNIGGGEILLIILLALLLFGPEDIMKIMRTIGKYTRAASRAWAQIRASLEGEILPEEVQDVVNETKDILEEVKDPLNEVTASVNEAGETLKEETRDLDAPLKTAARDAKVATAEATAEVKAEIAAAKTGSSKATAVTKEAEFEDVPDKGNKSEQAVEVAFTGVAETSTPDVVTEELANTLDEVAADMPKLSEVDTPSLDDILAVVSTIEVEEDVPQPESEVEPAEPDVPEDPGISEMMARLGKTTPPESNNEEATS